MYKAFLILAIFFLSLDCGLLLGMLFCKHSQLDLAYRFGVLALQNIYTLSLIICYACNQSQD